MTAFLYKGITRLFNVLVPFTDLGEKWIPVLAYRDLFYFTSFWEKLVLHERQV